METGDSAMGSGASGHNSNDDGDEKITLLNNPIAMLFEVHIEPVCIKVICLGGCATIGHLAVYAGKGNPMVTLCSILVIASILFYSLHVAGRRIIPRPRPKYA